MSSGPKGIWTLDLSIISRTLHQAELSAHQNHFYYRYLFLWILRMHFSNFEFAF
jgi:hypothetical protein